MLARVFSQPACEDVDGRARAGGEGHQGFFNPEEQERVLYLNHFKSDFKWCMR